MKTNYSTPSEIKSDNDFLAGIETDSLSAYLIYAGGSKVEYYCFLNGKVLFKGNDFRPSPLRNQDSIESVLDLMSFYTCQPGDTDIEYFASYTAEQMSWATSYACELLKGLIGDFENASEPEYQNRAKAYFKSTYTN